MTVDISRDRLGRQHRSGLLQRRTQDRNVAELLTGKKVRRRSASAPKRKGLQRTHRPRERVRGHRTLRSLSVQLQEPVPGRIARTVAINGADFRGAVPKTEPQRCPGGAHADAARGPCTRQSHGWCRRASGAIEMDRNTAILAADLGEEVKRLRRQVVALEVPIDPQTVSWVIARSVEPSCRVLAQGCPPRGLSAQPNPIEIHHTV